MRTTAFRGSLLAAAALVAVAAPSALAGSGSGPSAGSKPASSAGSPAAALHVVPFPGTPDAAPATPVIFSSLPPAELRSVTVTGSPTGSPGKLVGVRRPRPSARFSLGVQRYLGLPVLTWWHGNVVNGHGANGEDVIMGRSYRKLADLHAANGYSSDLHEFQITSRNTAL